MALAPMKKRQNQMAKVCELAQAAGFNYYRGMNPDDQLKILEAAFTELLDLRVKATGKALVRKEF